LLKTGSDKLFKLFVPDSLSVFIGMGNQIYYLHNDGNSLYSATVHIGSGPIQVLAAFLGDPGNNVLLLEYEGVDSLPATTTTPNP